MQKVEAPDHVVCYNLYEKTRSGASAIILMCSQQELRVHTWEPDVNELIQVSRNNLHFAEL